MKTYDHLRFSVIAEFKRKAEPYLQSLWADLMELEAAADESALFVARVQASRRLLAIGSAAGAANAQEVRILCQMLRLLVVNTTQVRDVINYEVFDSLYKKMRELTEALYAIQAPSPLPERKRQPAEPAFAEFSVN
jgi:hypothetical protein